MALVSLVKTTIYWPGDTRGSFFFFRSLTFQDGAPDFKDTLLIKLYTVCESEYGKGGNPWENIWTSVLSVKSLWFHDWLRSITIWNIPWGPADKGNDLSSHSAGQWSDHVFADLKITVPWLKREREKKEKSQQFYCICSLHCVCCACQTIDLKGKIITFGHMI